MYPLKGWILLSKQVIPDPDKWKDVDEDKYQLHLAAYTEGLLVVDEVEYAECFVLDAVRTIAHKEAQVSVDALLCVDMEGKTYMLNPEAVRLDTGDIFELYKRRWTA